MRFLRNRFVLAGLRLVALCGLVVVAGLLAGAAVGWPLGRIKFETSKAVRLDQARLVGSIDPEAAIATEADLPVGWQAGEPAVAMFGILNNDFCGESVDLPAALSEVKSSVFVSPDGEATLISQAIRVERWQNAREYVRSVERTVSDCDKFYNSDPEGNRRRIDIKEGQGEPPITDFVSRSYVSEDGGDIQFWSMMAVGDVVVALRYVGRSAPQHSFLPDLQDHILMRIAPQDFAPDGGDTRTDETDPDRSGSTGNELDELDDVEEPRLGEQEPGTPSDDEREDDTGRGIGEPVGGDGMGD